MTGTALAAQPSALSESLGLLLFFLLVAAVTVAGVVIKHRVKVHLAQPRYILEIRDRDDEDDWFQPQSTGPTRDIGHLRWAANQWGRSGYDTRILNLTDLDNPDREV